MKINIIAVWRKTGLHMIEADSVAMQTRHGDYTEISVRVFTDDKQLVDMTNRTLTLRMCMPFQEPATIFSTSGQGNTRGIVELAFRLPNSLPSGSYVWDLYLSDETTGVNSVTPLSSWKILSASH